MNLGMPCCTEKKHGCLVIILIVFLLFGASIAFGVSQIANNPKQCTKKSTPANTMNPDPSQEASILKVFESCGIGEITSASVFQEGEGHTAYHLEDKENKACKSIDYYLNGDVIAPVTNYYVNSAERDKYRVTVQLAIKELLNYPDTAKFPSISGWTFEIEDGTVIVQSTVRNCRKCF